MEQTTLFSIAPGELRALIADAVAEQLQQWQPPIPQPLARPVDDLMGRVETARFLRCSLSALQQWEKRSQLVPVRLGRKVLYRRSDVEAALAGRGNRR